PLLMSACQPSHKLGGPAAATHLVLSDDALPDLAAARGLVDLAAPADSKLVAKARGELHGGGVVLRPDDPRYAKLLAWAEAQVPPPAAADAAPVAGDAP